jgi:hypothetical protein
MEGLVHSDTHIKFAIHGEDRESEINIEGGEVDAQEIGAVNDGGQWVQSGAPAFGIGAGSDEQMPVQEGAPALGIGAGNDEQVPAVAAAPGFPIGAFNYRVWQEPDDSEAPGFGIQAGNGVDWQRHGEWHQDIDDIIGYIINDGGAPGFGIEAGNVVDWPVHPGGGPMHPGYLGGGPVHPGLMHPGGGPMHGVWPVNLGGGPMHPGGVPVLGGPMDGVWSMHLAGPVHLGPQEHGNPNLSHLFPDDFEEGELLEIGIHEEAVNGFPEILERVCESVEIDELAVEQGEDCAICLEALNHVEDDDNENGNDNRTLHRLPCSHLFHSHCI